MTLVSPLGCKGKWNVTAKINDGTASMDVDLTNEVRSMIQSGVYLGRILASGCVKEKNGCVQFLHTMLTIHSLEFVLICSPKNIFC